MQINNFTNVFVLKIFHPPFSRPFSEALAQQYNSRPLFARFSHQQEHDQFRIIILLPLSAMLHIYHVFLRLLVFVPCKQLLSISLCPLDM